MNNNYPQGTDPRPKRRRNKDNPYELFSVGIHTDHPRFFVCFKDGQGQFHCEEVSRELYEQLDSFELDDISEICGISRAYYGRAERGEHSLTVESCQKIANALNIRIADLFSELPD